jgi:hypothetical protein
MGGYSNYGGLQQPTGVYGDADASSSPHADSQGTPSSYPTLLQRGANPAPTQAPAANPSPSSDPQTVAEAMVDTMATIYKKPYSVKHGSKYITLGPKVGSKIPVKLVADADMTAVLTTQAQTIANDIIHSMLKFNPQSVRDQLVRYYAKIKEPFPANLSVIDENTVLTSEQQAALFGFMRGVLIDEVRKDVAETQGFFMLPQNAGDTGTMVVRSEFAQSASSVADLAGTIAHELAHAYADAGWRDFLRVMTAVGMVRTGKLEEGMATFFESEVIKEWLKSQPTTAPRPKLGYTDDPEVAESATVFIKAVSRKFALDAFFGGWVNFTDVDKPQDTIRVGEKHERAWKWPWQSLP